MFPLGLLATAVIFDIVGLSSGNAFWFQVSFWMTPSQRSSVVFSMIGLAIFYFAFLPQFVASDAQHPTLQLLALGLVFAGLTFLVKAPVGVSAGALSLWLRRRPSVLMWLYRSSGAVLLGLGVRLAFERRN